MGVLICHNCNKMLRYETSEDFNELALTHLRGRCEEGPEFVVDVEVGEDDTGA